MTFGEKLKQSRKNAELTQDQLGEKLDLVGATISLYESDKRSPDNRILCKIAKILNVTTDYLLYDNNVKRKSNNLNKFLCQTEVKFDGEVYKLDYDDREKLHTALKLAFYDAPKT